MNFFTRKQAPAPKPSLKGFLLIPQNLGRQNDLSEEGKLAVPSLLAHSGFRYLLAKLSANKAALEAKLLQSKPPSLREVDCLQAGIFWSGWLQKQLDQSVEELSLPAASSEEFSAFEQALSLIEELA